MSITRFFFAVLTAVGVVPLTHAQPFMLTASSPTTTSLYARQQIDLLPGFEATTSGFEASIRLPESIAGRWSTPSLWTDYRRAGAGTPITGMIGIHTHVLPNGKVLSWEGHNDDQHSQPGPGMILSHAYDWNPNPSGRNGSQVYPNVYNDFDIATSNIFCSGHTLLADGRLLVAGGHYSSGAVDRGPFLISDPRYNRVPVNNSSNPGYIPGTGDVDGYIGLLDANSFNHAGGITVGSNYVWQSRTPMQYRRWYPTLTTLGNGDVLAISGQRYGGPIGTNTGVQALIPEVYNGTSWQPLTGASRFIPSYPWMFLAPDGRVFNAGPNPDAKFLNPTAAAINSTPAGEWDGATYRSVLNLVREYGSAVMYAPGKILIMGGSTNTGLGVTNTTELIDLNNPATAQFRTAAPMQFARTHVNATVLADGTVLATGGSATRSTSEADAILPAELWQPGNKTAPGGTWTTLNAMAAPRLYHSTAVLLPDATVLTAGGGQGAGYKDRPTYQIFTPPYLCKGLARPQISSAPKAVAYGQTFTITGPQTSSFLPYGRVTLVRLSSVTHSFNMNQRYLELTPAAGPATNQFTLTAPSNRNICPPGHYMLFLVDGNGIPSHASIIAIDGGVCSTALNITQTNPFPDRYDTCQRTTTFTTSGGPAGSTYVWTVNGTVYGTTGPSDTIILLTSIGAPTVQVTVALAGNTGCGASSTLTSYFPGCQP